MEARTRFSCEICTSGAVWGLPAAAGRRRPTPPTPWARCKFGHLWRGPGHLPLNRDLKLPLDRRRNLLSIVCMLDIRVTCGLLDSISESGIVGLR
ncbi:hypothetical protein Zmor_020078 [Zophobas morio]|uniref:Uncharacterized protein n=1 Tax=Zophobas morio TaxID=2755281 RepID=A0AA38M9L1_9CUCU|nr:hypothetical protein Zmor_020078 [Zophobas morio]